MTNPLLSIEDLSVQFATRGGVLHALSGVSLTVDAGEIVGIVGETGCGKSTLALTVLRLLADNAAVTGSVRLGDVDILAESEETMLSVRGQVVSYIPQDPLISLDPTFSVGEQISETIRAHRQLGRRQARDEAVRLMAQVGIPDAARRYRDAPHVMSGGMRQRILIAIAVANSPTLIVADEPTTALDVTLQEQILQQLSTLRSEDGTAILIITHDLGVVSQICDRVAVLYAGRLVEHGPVASVLSDAQHPYTQALLRAMPGQDVERGRLEVIPGEVADLSDLGIGCPFAPRCPHRLDRCDVNPQLTLVGDDHRAACWLAGADL